MSTVEAIRHEARQLQCEHEGEMEAWPRQVAPSRGRSLVPIVALTAFGLAAAAGLYFFGPELLRYMNMRRM
jgi:hypothetical protein